MKHTTTDGGVGSGDERGQSDLRDCRSIVTILRVKDGLTFLPRVSVRRACGAASRGVVRRGGWPAPHRWRHAPRAGLLKGRRHRHLDDGVGRVSNSVALERWCWSKLQGSAGRSSQCRYFAAATAVSTTPGAAWLRGCGEHPARGQRRVYAGPGGVVIIISKGPDVASGSAHSSLSNSRLKLTARGRSVSEAPRRARAAA